MVALKPPPSKKHKHNPKILRPFLKFKINMIDQNQITALIITSAVKSIPEIRKNMHAVSKLSGDLNFIEDTLENIKKFSGIDNFYIVHDFKIDSIYSKIHNDNLNKIKDSIDIINIFRHPDHVLPIVNDSIKINPKVIWFQDGVVNCEAIDLANKNGIQTIVDDCIYRRHKVYINSN